MVVLSTCCAKAAAFRAVILGAPASGKGTVSSRIIKDFKVAHISSGDKLRLHIAEGTGIFIFLMLFLNNIPRSHVQLNFMNFIDLNTGTIYAGFISSRRYHIYDIKEFKSFKLRMNFKNVILNCFKYILY